MKSKRILSFLLVVVFLATQFAMLGSVSAQTQIPSIVQSEGMRIFKEGVEYEGTYGTASLDDYYLPGYKDAHIGFGEVVDLTKYDYIEFDYYVENLENLQSRVTGIRLQVRHKNSSNAQNFEFLNQLTQDGWNHIKLSLEVPDNRKFVLENANRVRFLIDLTAGNVGANDRYLLANLYVTNNIANDDDDNNDDIINSEPLVAPDIIESEGMRIFTEGIEYEGTYGKGALDEGYMPGQSPGSLGFGSAIDFTAYNYIEFDYYVENLDNLKSRVSRLVVQLANSAGNADNFDYLDQLTQNGWNHVSIFVLDARELVLTTARRLYFYIHIDSGNVGAYDRYAVANVCAVKGDQVFTKKLPYNPIVNVGKDQTEAYITWFTQNNTGCKLVFDGNDIAPYESGLSDDKTLYYHRAKVTNLEENTTYNYFVCDDESSSGTFTLKTKDFDNDFSFIQVSDVQLPGNTAALNNWKKTLSQINTNLPDTSFILDTGDIADTTKTELFGYYKSPKLLPNYITAVVHGNHGSTPDSYFNEHFTTPETYEEYPEYASGDCDYWFGYNSVLFISLNTNIRDIDYHKNFISNVVESQGNKYNWIIVNCHHSLFGASYHRNESDVSEFRAKLAPFFSEMGIDMVLSGHDHCYARSYMMEGTNPNVSSDSFSANTDGGVLYISAQSASAMKFNDAESGAETYSAKIVEDKFGFISYDVTDAAITLTYYSSADMSVLDQFTLYKDDSNHVVESDKNLLKDKNLKNVKLDSNGKYTVSFDNSEDISSACSIELDIGLSKGNLDSISITLIDAYGKSISKNFANIKAGWNNLSSKISDIPGDANLSKIVALEITGPANTEISLANLYVGHVYLDGDDTTCEVCDYERNLLMDPNKVPNLVETDDMRVFVVGTEYDGIYGTGALTEGYLPGYKSVSIGFGGAIDLTSYGYIEFDYYVENIDNLKSRVSRLVVQMVNESGNGYNFDYLDQLTQNGWNHVKISTENALQEKPHVLETARKLYFYIYIDEGEVGANDRYLVANIYARLGEFKNLTPALPNDVVSVLGDENGPFFAGNTVGQKYHFTLDRIYKERFQPIDFSKTNKIEFDVYVNDYEKFLAAENNPNDARESKLAFEVSSTPPALWDQYTAPRHYFSSAIDLADYITHSGWNHVSVSKQDFIAVNNGGVDWSAITAFLVFYRGSSNYYPYDNPYSDLFIKVGNIVNTGIYADVPKDGEKEEKPDKSAVYINTAEALADSNGAWNTMGGYVSNDYKTEGKASILQQVGYSESIDDTRMIYIFDNTADMSDIKTLRFDFFIDIPNHIKRSGNNIEILLGNNRFVKNDYYFWNIDIDSLKVGWNSIELSFEDAKSNGSPNLESVKVFALRFTEINLDSENFAIIEYGIDNLRYISSTGNKILKVEGIEEEKNDQFDTNYEGIEDADNEIVEKVEVAVNKTGEVKYNKILEKSTVTNYTMIIIALIIEAVVIIAGLVVFTIVSIKKSKKKKE